MYLIKKKNPRNHIGRYIINTRPPGINMASDAKKLRNDDVSDERKYDEGRWLHAILTMCYDMDTKSPVILTPLRINVCNAAVSKGTSFSKAFCDAKQYDECYMFGDIFHYGIEVLRNYMENKSTPKNQQLLFVFQKLLDFLNSHRSINLPSRQNLQSISEAELTVLVASNLLGKLGTSSCYLIDKNCCEKEQDKSFCGEISCEMTGEFGDTSIGHMEVWHGNMDIIINSDLAVEVLDDNPHSPGGKSAVKHCLQRNPQIVAQTIVFSFLQKKKHPERSNFLTPCIGIGSKDLIVMLYDSEHDVLLESSTVPLFEDDFSLEFSLQAILVCWLTVNYKFLCSGLRQKYKLHKSNFFDHAKKKIQIYEDKLLLGNVGNSQLNEENFVLRPSNVIRSDNLRDATSALYLCLAKVSQSDCPDSSDGGTASSS